MSRLAEEAVRRACQTYTEATQRAALQLTSGDTLRFGDLMVQMLALPSQPMVFGSDQTGFYRTLDRLSGIVYDDAGSAGHVVLHMAGSDYMRTGIVRVLARPLVEALCQLLNDAQLCAGVPSITHIPCRLMVALLFWAPEQGYPLRAWTVRRFLAAESNDARIWSPSLTGEMRLLQTVEYLDLTYCDSLVRASDPRLLDERARIEHRSVLRVDEMSYQWTHSAAAQRVMELTMPRMLLSFYSLFMHYMYSTGVSNVQLYWELALAMLLNWPLQPFAGLLRQVPATVLSTISHLAESMRDFVRAPTTGGLDFVRAIYARSSDFDKAFLANQGVRAMLMQRATAREYMELFYVPTTECALSTLTARLCRGPQLGQLRGIMDWLTETTTRWSLGHLLDASTANASELAELDRVMFACTLPRGIRVHRLRWTLEYMQNAHPALFGGLMRRSYVGLDSDNCPFLVVERTLMDSLRLVMTANALTLRSYHKSTAVYPLLLRLYLTHRPAAAAYNTLARHVFAHVVGYWLCIPELSASTFDRDGMPGLRESIDYMGMLHRVAHVLDTPSLTMESLNAVRSFFMIKASHRISAELTRLLADANNHLPADDDIVVWVAQTLECMDSARLVEVRSRGRPRARADDTVELTSGMLERRQFRACLRSRYPHNPLCYREGDARIALFNHWVYAIALDWRMPRVNARQMLLEFAVDRVPLTDSNYRRARYNVPSDFAVPWQQSNEFFVNVSGIQYCYHERELRPELVSADFSQLVRFLQQLEFHVCASDVARQTMCTRPLPPNDAALLRELNALYRDPQRVLNAMPVAAYFDNMLGRHQLITWETALVVADMTPASTETRMHSQASRAINGDESGASSLSDIAVDVVTMFGGLFVEQHVADPAATGNVYNQIVSANKAQKL